MTASEPRFEATLDPGALESLLARIDPNGVDFDGLRLEPATAETYDLVTPKTQRGGVSPADLADAEPPVTAYLTNWRYWQDVDGEGTARRAFLRWCERAPLAAAETETTPQDDREPLPVPERYAALEDGIDREWGQLRITVRLTDDPETAPGERVYDLTHRADADRDLADLEIQDGPRDARRIATEDDDGRYRPLKTAPTLVSGWAFVGLSGAELVETVDTVYPATIANWHRELRGDLDVDHWRETADRQTGMYADVADLPREAVEWMAEACCVDSQCLKRREWEYAPEDELAVDGGDGPFPCREPCSLVVAAARTWTDLEREPERTYELELTPSEARQLEALIDAVAEGRTDEIREADVADGANRYRARYLRAKRFDEDGLELADTSSSGPKGD
ncbi:hypothetical protein CHINAEXTREME_19860 [Halobiforma lacisalsi AJ5]|uniref:Uncharacterized protein n=1 Tax=Natronobacterium lacisalsi AJ5 TaxID=358396 RepID=M0LS47_NATLA|nr:DR2241 family protein [Halobiforma lacisalsi]APW99886.1 hypothetical protein CHINAEXTREME_19860 [Halobiforma lacisalsi AJ5]EMA35928.1 hypothetical protein C445_03693 [Halobiforma lacisalsi AJ5]